MESNNINITPSFFENNGFKFIYDEYPAYYFNNFKEEILEREPNAEGLYEYEMKVNGEYVIFNYVHELQNILREMGYNELADNLIF